jgi:hypothetical protein
MKRPGCRCLIAMTLKEFSRQLHLRMDCTGRPFVCDGSPLTCAAFIVGLNPTTGSFWPYWDNSHGFDKDAWFIAYRRERKEEGNREVSNTRIRLDKVIEQATPVRCLTTNVYAAHSHSGAELPSSERRTDVFQFLLESIKPKALILHGSDAHREVGRILSVDGFSTERFAPVVMNGRSVMVHAVPHARFWSYAAAEAFGRDLRKAVGQ